MAEKISNVSRIILKILVTIITLFIFIMAVVYWAERITAASVPLLIVSALTYFCVIKDHSEDFWRSKCSDRLTENLVMMIIYIVALLAILFGIVIAVHLK